MSNTPFLGADTPANVNNEVIVTCAVTGAGDTVGKHPAIPVTPEEIANAALEAGEAGAAVAHIHVRDPKTGKGSRETSLYAEVMERIRAAGSDIIINLTAGMGGDLYLGPDEDPTGFRTETDLVGAATRLVHIEALRPEICTLDCGSLNFGDANLIYVSTPEMIRAGARRIRELGVKPELEIFDTGNLWLALQMVRDGLLEDPPLFQLCHGIPWGAPPDIGVFKASVDQLPSEANWTGFALGRNQMPFAAQAVLLGGNIRVGLEDNLYLERGVFATNGQLVERACKIAELLGARTLSPKEARAKLGLKKSS